MAGFEGPLTVLTVCRHETQCGTDLKKLHEAATNLAGGRNVDEVCKSWVYKPGHIPSLAEGIRQADLETVREYKALKEKSAWLKRLVADLSLDNQALKEPADEKGQARTKKGGGGSSPAAVGVSERPAFKMVEQTRSNQRHASEPND